MNKESLLLVVSGPSGVGKGTIFKRVMKEVNTLEYSVSVTTRQPRPGEKEGINYFFKSVDQFQEMLASNLFLEHANVYNNLYGTPKEYVLERMSSGHDVLLEIDVQGAMMVKESWANAVFVFIAPPSMNDLVQRLKGRGTETPEALERRLSEAKNEISLIDQYDYIVVNDDVECAAKEIVGIVRAEKCKVGRNMDFAHQIRQQACVDS